MSKLLCEQIEVNLHQFNSVDIMQIVVSHCTYHLLGILFCKTSLHCLLFMKHWIHFELSSSHRGSTETATEYKLSLTVPELHICSSCSNLCKDEHKMFNVKLHKTIKLALKLYTFSCLRIVKFFLDKHLYCSYCTS